MNECPGPQFLEEKFERVSAVLYTEKRDEDGIDDDDDG